MADYILELPLLVITASVNTTGLATDTLQTTGNNTLSAISGKLGGRAKASAPARLNYVSTNVTTGAYVELVASTTSATSQIEIFDSSGETLEIAVGALASEVAQIYIVPGGNKIVPLLIPAGSRVAVKAVSNSATTGELVINFYT